MKFENFNVLQFMVWTLGGTVVSPVEQEVVVILYVPFFLAIYAHFY